MVKNLLLIDADSVIPNVALMKLSSYYKSNNYNISLIRLEIPYYPNRKKIYHIIDTKLYDKIYCSVIFDNSIKYIEADRAIFGGTGVSLSNNLPDEIEACDCDYSIYPDNNISYGFISRGCIRNCSFCKVPEKEGYIRQVNTIDNIVKHKKVVFLDNNILALPNCKDILKELVNKKIRCQFNAGLDIRLVDKDISFLLSQMNYMGEYTFAFDDIRYKDIILDKLLLLDWRTPYKLRFFIYINPKQSLSSIVKRIELLRENKLLPYIMRDISCWDSDLNEFYVDLASWCNQPNIFKKMDFKTFLDKRHTKNERILNSYKLWRIND